MHDNIQLDLACERDEDISNHNFLGIFPADKIPSYIPDFCCFILNTDPSSKSGRHWVCVINRNGAKYYFDSYGLSPSIWNNGNRWKQLNNYERSNVEYQHDDSDVCGDYCIFILKCLSMDRTMTLTQCLQLYFDKNNSTFNDALVWESVHSYFPNTLDNFNHEIIFDKNEKPSTVNNVTSLLTRKRQNNIKKRVR